LKKEAKMRKEILLETARYHDAVHGSDPPFVPGKSRIPYAGRVFDAAELENLIDSALDFWLTAGRYSAKFEAELAQFLGLGHCHLVNSGSSANLLAFMALTSEKLGDRKIERGDEVITVAAGFPTTVSPVIQYGAVPVFVDVGIPSYNVDCDQLAEALSPRTRAVILAHTLGNPFDIDRVKSFCDRNHLWLLEDNCDSLGSLYKDRYTGTFGDIGTSSFYPPHHITMGEGGALYTNEEKLSSIVLSLRDWGRDCRCPSGMDNTCGKRFSQQFGELPYGYDHKYVYSDFGYNLKATDLQAAIGCAQLEKLPGFIAARRKNFSSILEGLSDLEEFFILPEPTPESEPSWFGFPLTIREKAPFSREELVRHLEENNIQTRMLFAGNIIKHPCFDKMRREKSGYRQVGDLANTEKILQKTFWIGVYPGLTAQMIGFISDCIHSFTRSRSGNQTGPGQ